MNEYKAPISPIAYHEEKRAFYQTLYDSLDVNKITGCDEIATDDIAFVNFIQSYCLTIIGECDNKIKFWSGK